MMPAEHRPRKRFGQHFLHDSNIIAKLVRTIAPVSTDRLVEIGPGLGALTLPLLEAAGRLQVVELDRDVIPILKESCAALGELTVHEADALKFDFRTLATDGPIRLVGNLPYNISTPLLFHLLDQSEVIVDMHFMLQKEVVERMAAGAGDEAYGRLSVMLAARCSVEPLFTIGPGAFKPPPKVDSAVVRLVPWQTAPFPIPDPERFARIVNQAFSRRRKTLRNALKGLVDSDQMETAGVDPSVRPETLSPAEFGKLAILSP